MKILNIKGGKQWLMTGVVASLLLCSCGDLDIVPEGKSTLEKTSELELLLNTKILYDDPNTFLGIVVNETYGTDLNATVEQKLKVKNTLNYAYLAFDEETDRAKLNTKDDFYSNVYGQVNTMNVLLSKIDDAQGNDNLKPAIKAEAEITRAYYLFLAANIYAKQYDEATLDGAGGIAYPTDPAVDTKPQLTLKECYDKMLDSWDYPTCEQLSLETVSLIEPGDYLKDHSSFWDAEYGEADTGIPGCLEAYGYQAYITGWGFRVEQIMYLAAECYIRTGEIQKGLDLINKVREKRIDTEHYKTFTASNEKDAMELLQRAKTIECIGSYMNFFDRKRWNTEEAYKKTLVRDLGELGKFSIAPDSKLWIFPFPTTVMQKNPSFHLNYE